MFAGLNRPVAVAVTSGKGGVGKSVISMSLAEQCAAKGVRTLLIDVDLGLGNQHLLLGQSPIFTFEDVLERACEIDEAVLRIAQDLCLLPARNGFAHTDFVASLSVSDVRSIFRWLNERFDLLILDCGAGISSKVMVPAKLADAVLIITTPEVAAVADSYAVAKFLVNENQASKIGLVVNRAANVVEGGRTGENLQAMMRRFLKHDTPQAAIVPECNSLGSIIMSHNRLTEDGDSAGWSHSIEQVRRLLADCLPEGLTPWENGHWGASEPFSPLNLSKENDDTLNTASEAGEIHVPAEHELPTSRKDSL
jgi:flagellar biosynthesis protein FlhG